MSNPLPIVGDSVEWFNIHSGITRKHSGIIEEFFERNKKVMASVKSSGRRKIVPAGRLTLSSRTHNAKGKAIETSHSS